MIQFLNVTKNYVKGKVTALNGVNLAIDKGEFIVLVGPSGAGKSTLIRLLVREELPSTGKIMVAGRDITRIKERDLPYYRRNVGIVFQDFKLLPNKTVYENVSYALELSDEPDAVIKDKVPRILRLVGLKERANNYPAELSGGERQRTSIARALVHNPKLLIADEPTGNLDEKNTAEVIDLLLRINEAGTIVLLATHDLDIVRSLKKRVICLNNGQLQLVSKGEDKK
ncbi:MAG TPA: cell division ATP-binding protein FtsE [bacterium]|nr:cell division ATP-binding protein FtsE [bacterium]HOR57383.1 cell division ATP-binding protein FtsE [bacterium]HPL56194.1 cell division ATP-binding protein FtsE [bacterium]HPM27606.1 cell division ATP-binding protein FtsE [bacterium]